MTDSTLLHTSTTKVGYIAETNYAGGVAGAKYAMTQIANNAALASINMQKADMELGIPEVDRVQIKPATAAPDAKFIFNKGYRYKEFKIEQYIQTEIWAAQAGTPITPGTLHTSYTFHCEIPGVNGVMDYFDIFGCTLIEYEIDQPEDGDFPTERLTFSYYDIGDGVAHSTLGGFLSSAPSTHKDISLSIDAEAIPNLLSANLKITLDTLDKKVATKYQRFDPQIVSRDVNLQAKFYSNTTVEKSILGDELAIAGALTAIHEVAVALTYISTAANLSASKMFADTTSIGKVPAEMGIYEYSITMKTGAANAVAHNT